jgi:hypothetical protein
MKVLTIIASFILIACASKNIAQLSVPGHWVPDKAQKKEAFNKFYTAAKTKAEQIGYEINNWDDYRLQYAGVWEHREKYIHIIAVCSELWPKAKRWREQWVTLPEYAPCYFSATYSVSRKQIEVHMESKR